MFLLCALLCGLGGSLHTVKKDMESLVIASMEICLGVTAAKTKYMVMSQDQNAGPSSILKIGNKYSERVEQFKCSRTTLMNPSSIREKISRLKSGNACCHSVQNLLSSSLLSRNVKIKIYRAVILPVVLFEYETWSLTSREECS
jgi:hypothetical protein